MPVFISFSLKPLQGTDRTFKTAILPSLESIAKTYPGWKLHHGFMPREEVVKRGFSTEVVDALDQLFPEQVPYYMDGTVNRERMAQVASGNGQNGLRQNAKVFVIGPVVDGVKEEVAAYELAGCDITFLSWGDKAPDYAPPYAIDKYKTEAFNPSAFHHHGGEVYDMPVYRFNDETGKPERSDVVQFIQFLRGHKDKAERQSGITTEALLALLIDRLTRLNSEVPDNHTIRAIHHISEALNELLEREAERKAAGVLNTGKETPKEV